MTRLYKVLISLLFLLNTIFIFAQQTKSDTITATFTAEKINFDGNLNETAWQKAKIIANFTQRELDFGQPATEKTKVAIIYDKLAIYIGVWCYQKSKISAKYMQRDFRYREDDNFQVILSPFNDHRNGYLFIINPNGARADLLISGNERANKDWNGVWDVKTKVNSEGWFAEIRIPFNTLQFRKSTEYAWAINFERDIRAINEQVLWRGWSRDCSIYCLVNAGTLSGLKNIGYAKRFELKPYGLASFKNETGEPDESPAKFGADLNINLSPTLKMNLTYNTDFAQVEADRIAVNLTRFNLFYPEKREFFLEGYQNFRFNMGGPYEAFYTRKIGIEDFEPVKIIGGAKIYGKVGKNNIGALNITTAQEDSIPATNNTVIRYKRDIGEQSYVGFILTSKNNENISNQVAGIDGAYSTSHFLQDKNLVIGGHLTRSFDKDQISQNVYAWRFFVDYPNDLIDNYIGVSSIQGDFNPELGFVYRDNFDSFIWSFRFTPRWFTKYGIRQMAFKPWGFRYYRTNSSGKLESFYNETRPFGFETKKGERSEFNLIQQYERLDEGFDLADSITIPTGEYWMFRQELQFETYQGRKLWIFLLWNWGDFYTGKINTFESALGINVNKYLNLRTDYSVNIVNLPEGNVTTHELAQYIRVAINPKLNFTLFTQWNSLDDLLLGNFRLNWIPKIGSDLYLVYNRGYVNLKEFDFMRPETTSGAIKLVWRITF